MPFHGSNLGTPNLSQFPVEGLWLLKPDTFSAALLTPPGLSSAVGRSSQGKLRLIGFGDGLPTDAVQSLAPPAACVPPLGWNGKTDSFAPCTDFYFSASGNLLGYEIPIQGCARQLYLLELKTNRLVLAIKDRGHFLRPLPNGRWLVATGSCGEGIIAQYDPQTNSNRILGPEPVNLVWNAQRTAFFAHVFNEGGHEVGLWGYNVATSQIFFSMSAQDDQYNSEPTWTPDGQAVIFQYRKGILTDDGTKVGFYNPGHLIRVDINTKTQSKIADPSGDLVIAPGWYGEYLMVRRYPFQVRTFDANTLHFSDELPPVMKCATRGNECSQPPDLLAYQYKTSQLVPWSQTGLPAAAAAADARLPTLDLEHPLYEDPNGAFRILLGSPMPYMPDTLAWQGYASLWYLPRGGQPILWVESGRGFVYVP